MKPLKEILENSKIWNYTPLRLTKVTAWMPFPEPYKE